MNSDIEAGCIAAGRTLAMEQVLAALLARLTPAERSTVSARLHQVFAEVRELHGGNPGGDAVVGGFELQLRHLKIID